MKPLVVFGCPVANRSWVIDKWWASIAAQTQCTDYRWKVVFVYTDSDDDTLGKLEQMQDWHDVRIIDAGESPRTRDDMNAHRWPLAHIERMAEWRNMILDYAIEEDAEYLFSVDSDIILPPRAFGNLSHTLRSRVDYGYAACAPLVNMASHIDTFAYNYMSWVDGGVTAQATRSSVPTPTVTFPADVIMAAMLIHRSLFEARWAPHEQGEDIGWSWHATQLGKRMYVDPGIVCNHLMKPTA